MTRRPTGSARVAGGDLKVERQLIILMSEVSLKEYLEKLLEVRIIVVEEPQAVVDKVLQLSSEGRIDWAKIQHFTSDEWPDGVLDRVEPRLVVSLDRFRKLYGAPVYPSTDPEAWVRTSGSPTSRHFAIGRKSDAGDCFLGGDIREAFQVAAGMRIFGGIGLYFDTFWQKKPQPMIHLDLRKSEVQVWWVRIGGSYFYAHKDTERGVFFNTLAGIT